MRLSFSLAVVKVKDLKKKKVGGRRSILKDDSRFAAICREIPEDILIEILVRLPVYSLMNFKCVSKLWSSLISSRYFTNLFFNFSLSTKRERRVFVYEDDHMLFSSSLSNLDTTASFPTLNFDLTLPCIKNDRLDFVNALRGLMCFNAGRDIRIINFTTKQVLSLPLVKSNMLLEIDDCDVWNYFGYDSVNDEYKVLSIISSVYDDTNEWRWRSETQVLVLGEGASWRNTKNCTFSPPPHDPLEGEISINGVLYYGALIYGDRCVLMSFDFSSEEFNLIELPMEYGIKRVEFGIVDLMNYQDDVAVFDDFLIENECNLDIWVLEDAGKSKWSHKVLVLPYHHIRESLKLEDMDDDLRIRGTSHNREVTLCGSYVNSNKSTYAFYDLEKNHITRGFVIDPPYSISRFSETKLWEDVESIMYLEL